MISPFVGHPTGSTLWPALSHAHQLLAGLLAAPRSVIWTPLLHSNSSAQSAAAQGPPGQAPPGIAAHAVACCTAITGATAAIPRAFSSAAAPHAPYKRQNDQHSKQPSSGQRQQRPRSFKPRSLERQRSETWQPFEGRERRGRDGSRSDEPPQRRRLPAAAEDREAGGGRWNNDTREPRRPPSAALDSALVASGLNSGGGALTQLLPAGVIMAHIQGARSLSEMEHVVVEWGQQFRWARLQGAARSQDGRLACLHVAPSSPPPLPTVPLPASAAAIGVRACVGHSVAAGPRRPLPTAPRQRCRMPITPSRFQPHGTITPRHARAGTCTLLPPLSGCHTSARDPPTAASG